VKSRVSIVALISTSRSAGRARATSRSSSSRKSDSTDRS
jgi:hypothetical protein